MPRHETAFTAQIEALHRDNPGMSTAEIARRVGCHKSLAYVVLARRGGTAPAKPAVRHLVGMDGPTFRRIRDRAEECGLGFDAVAGRLLTLAIERGLLDAQFTPGGRT
jgi:transposase-like protein